MLQSQVVDFYQTVPNTIRLCDPLPIPVGYSITVRQELGTGVRSGDQHVTEARLLPTRKSCFMVGL
jgi:hypothetical protein